MTGTLIIQPLRGLTIVGAPGDLLFGQTEEQVLAALPEEFRDRDWSPVKPSYDSRTGGLSEIHIDHHAGPPTLDGYSIVGPTLREPAERLVSMGHRPAVYNYKDAPHELATFAELVDGWRHWEERYSTPDHVAFVDIGVYLSTHGGTEDEGSPDDHEYGEPVLNSVMLFPEGYFQDDDYKETLLS